VLLERGHVVSGSDRLISPLAQSLQEAGARVSVGHRAENVQGAGLVVRSSAISNDNPEVLAAQAAGIPVVKRLDFLGQLMDGQTCLAVAGTHGKTTTTAMLAWMLTALGQDPSYIIGGIALNLGTNAHAGKGQYFVIEADEYDHMFLGLRPKIAVVTNVEHDHPDCYPTPQDFQRAFLEFVGCIQPEGLLLACGDDPGAARLLSEANSNGQRTVAYGLHSVDYAYRAQNTISNPRGGFDAQLAIRQSVVSLSLQVPGIHNVLNALAVMAVADQVGLDLAEAARALGVYRGTGRRFEVRGQSGGVTVVDDYAHHPTEIRATLAAARARYPGQDIWAVWQPHTYSRTRTLLGEFATAFEDADHVFVTDIYSAREANPANGFSARQVVSAMKHPDARYTSTLVETTNRLLEGLHPGEVLLVLSAGDADQISTRVLNALSDRQPR
jgi:UDP-N-acetylmuramate--alanine ligase